MTAATTVASGSNALLKRLLKNAKPPPGTACQSSDNSARNRLAIANITPEEQRQMGACNSTAPPAQTAETFDPFPWNPQMGFSPEVWVTLPRKEKQHIYGATLFADNIIHLFDCVIVILVTASHCVPWKCQV